MGSDDERPANPYVGPRPFEPTEVDQDRFFGRSHEIDQLVARIAGHQVVLVYAQSGAGKTSLYNAGVRRQLLRSGYQVLPSTRVVGAPANGNSYVANALAGLGLGGGDLAAALDELAPLHDRLGRREKRVVVFDQFEELFADPSADAHELRREFFAQVDEALARDGLLRLVFMMREDRVALLVPYSRSVRHHFKVRYRLERLDVESAREAIEEPAARYGRHFDEAAVDYLVDELRALRSAEGEVRGEGLYVEPVSLQVVCYGMWPHLDPNGEAISRADVEEHGDVTAHLGSYYDRAVEQVAEAVDGVGEGTLRAFVGAELITREYRTRGTVERGTEETGGQHPVPSAAVDALVDLHVVSVERRAGADWYELAHDRFVEPILERNAEWVAERWAEKGRPYEAEARAWVRLDHDPKALLEGARLREAQKRIAHLPSTLVLPVVEEFIAASVAQEEEEERLRNVRIRRSRIRWIVAAVLLAVMFLVAVWGWVAAEMRRRTAESRALAAAAQASVSAGDRLDRPLLLAVAAARTQPEDEARASLLAALTAGSRLTSIRVEEDAALSALDASGDVIAAAGLAEDEDRVGSFLTIDDVRVPFGELRIDVVALSRDGERLAVPAGDAGSVAIVDVGDDARFDLPASPPAARSEGIGHTGRVAAMAFDPTDPARLATAGVDGRLIMWDLDDRVPSYFVDDLGAAAWVTVGMGGERLALAAGDRVHLLDAADGSVLRTAGFDGVRAVAFGPGGELAAGSQDGRVVVWTDPEAGLTGRRELRASGWAVADLEFYGGGAGLAVAAGDGKVDLLSVDGDTTEALRGHFVDRLPGSPAAATEVQVRQALPVVALGMSAGDEVVSASADGSIVRWSVDGPPGFGTPRGTAPGCEPGAPFDLAWGNRTLRGTCAGGFSVEPGGPVTIPGIPQDGTAAWAADGSAVAVAGAGRIEVYAADGAARGTVDVAGEAEQVALADNDRVAWSTGDGRLFRSRLGAETPDVVQLHGASFTSLAISPDGAWVAAGDAFGRVSRWRAGTPDDVETVVLAPCDVPDEGCAVADLAFVPGENCVVAAGPVGLVVRAGFTGCVSAEVFGHTHLVTAVALSRDGDLLASGDRGGGIILSDARTLLQMARLDGPQGAVVTLAFGDDDVLAAGMAGGSMLEWELGIDELVDLACAKLGDTDLPPDARDRYGVDGAPCS